MRSAEISWDVTNAWETWSVEVPDDAPNPITPEWVMDNMEKIEFVDLKDRGHWGMKNPEINWCD